MKGYIAKNKHIIGLSVAGMALLAVGIAVPIRTLIIPGVIVCTIAMFLARQSK